MDVFANPESKLRRILIVLGLAALVSFLFYTLFAWGRLLFLLPLWAAYAFALTPLVRLVAVVGVWWRSKLSAYLYVAVTAIDIAVCYRVGDVAASIYGVMGSVLLIVFVWPNWQQMSWLLANYSFKRTADVGLR